VHHPFTRPHPEDVAKLEAGDYANVRAVAYDVVLNGYELGGGSIRIHERDLQAKMFEVLGVGPEEQQIKFGHILDAFRFGAPPHGGLALGLDRIAMLVAGEDSIREVIAFPKNNKGADLMSPPTHRAHWRPARSLLVPNGDNCARSTCNRPGKTSQRSWLKPAAFLNRSASDFPNWLPEISASTNPSEPARWSIGTCPAKK
jgi:hypothetical protein